MQTPEILFQPYQLNPVLTLKNKIIMAPMTRAKANDDFTATPTIAAYYAKRADAGLIITEGTLISPSARGHNNIPGIFTEAQIAAWQATTSAVHQRDGLIFLQLWHVGRASHPVFLQGELPISASATTMTGHISRAQGLNYGAARAATQAEIAELVATYAQAARNALAAGFDGIEIHGANGYLIDQFLHHHTNHRTDHYGQTPADKARFCLEVVAACGAAIGYERVGLRLSPGAYLNEIVGDPRDAAVFQYLLNKLNELPLAYVHTGNFADQQIFPELGDLTMTAFIRKHYHGTLIACGSYTVETASQGISTGEFDLIAFGRPFIANPDLIERIQTGAAIKPYQVEMLNSLN